MNTRTRPSDRTAFNMMDGVLLVDKPKDWTSHDVCAFVRKNFKVKKVGHAGTLDPMATGLLVLLLGKATKQSAALSACEKEYEGVMELGLKTDSHDRTGEVLEESPWESISIEDVRETVKQFTGEILQTPPMVSALKHQGVRLYKLARKGKTIPREPRPVRVLSFDLGEKTDQFIHFSVKVSKGTYVRTLIHDLGETMGCFATLSELRRISSGRLHADQGMITIDELRDMDFKALRRRVIPLWEISEKLGLKQEAPVSEPESDPA